MDPKNIISASVDKTMRITDLEGKQKTWIDCADSYTTMWPLRTLNDTSKNDSESDNYIIAASTKPQLHMYRVSDSSLSIVHIGKTK